MGHWFLNNKQDLPLGANEILTRGKTNRLKDAKIDIARTTSAKDVLEVFVRKK